MCRCCWRCAASSKSFPGVRALDGVDLEVAAGEVHCLLGQNGAGKSTLIKVLAGVHQPDAGHSLARRAGHAGQPAGRMRRGIATIYQELDLVDGLSVAENVFLGHEIATGGFTRARLHRARTRELLARLGHAEIPPARRSAACPPRGSRSSAWRAHCRTTRG